MSGFRYPYGGNHRCHKPTCSRRIPPSLLACKEHWYELPKNLRDEIWRTYRKGQERTKDPSAEYLEALEHCIAFW